MEFEDLDLTEKQLKATKAVYRAIRKAHKLGVNFWDNYGTLTAFNGNKITLPYPQARKIDEKGMFSTTKNYDPTYSEILPSGAFNAGNADDELFYEYV